MLKANLIKQFNYCNAIANDIIEHNKSKEIQEYAKQFAEIESPLVGGTGADWIRINWGDIYIFLCDNGSIGYQVDPLASYYGNELIDMGYWFPALKNAVSKQCFFKIPETKILKVPLPLLQLTRCEFGSLTPTTIDIVNRWAYEAFDLDENKTYFVKTGTYSSKFDFRNAKVTTPKEVRELGSYLLFIHFQALQMASPLARPCIYGVSTTNEWCVREYIEDKENNPCIYHGMPLHTEYRVFIDCDTDEVLGIAPYWKPDVMKKRFSQGSDADTADMKHDYIIYKMHEEKLMSRYEENKDMLVDRIAELLPEINLTGQWSLDIMQNGNDFWLIDMATADTSALNECVPPEKLKRTPENWIPKLPDISSITHH